MRWIVRCGEHKLTVEANGAAEAKAVAVQLLRARDSRWHTRGRVTVSKEFSAVEHLRHFLSTEER